MALKSPCADIKNIVLFVHLHPTDVLQMYELQFPSRYFYLLTAL